MDNNSIIWVTNLASTQLYQSWQWKLANHLAKEVPLMIVAYEPRRQKTDLSALWQSKAAVPPSRFPTKQGGHKVSSSSGATVFVLIIEETFSTRVNRTGNNSNIAYFAESYGFVNSFLVHSGLPQAAQDLRVLLDSKKLIYFNNRVSGSEVALLTQDETQWLNISDVVTTRSEKHFDAFKKIHPKVHLLEEGIDTDPFESINQTQPDPNRPAAIYLGPIGGQLDYQLIYNLANQLPNWKFNLAGPILAAKRSTLLNQRTNIRQLGPVPHDKLTTILKNTTVGILPSKKFLHEHKQAVVQYLAAGLPVVSLCQVGSPELENHITVVSQTADWVNLIEKIKTQHKPEQRMERFRVAQQKGWEKRAEEFLHLICV